MEEVNLGVSEILDCIDLDQDYDSDSDCIIVNNNSHSQARQKAMVYTTKLEDMRIFKKDFTDMSFENITGCILNESKPKFKKIGRRGQYKCSISHKKLIKKLNIINFKSRNKKYLKLDETGKSRNNYELSKRSQLLYKACKPVSVVLKDILVTLFGEKNNVCETAKLKLSRNCIETLKPSCMLLKGKDTDSVLSINDTIANHRSTSQDQKFIVVFVVLQYNEIDLFHLNNGIVTEYRTFNNTHNFADVEIPIDTEVVIHLECCCWYKKNSIIDKLELQTITKNAARIMKKRHKCPRGQCNCCCAQLYNTITWLKGEIQTSLNNDTPMKSIEDIDEYLLSKEDLELHLLEKEISENIVKMHQKYVQSTFKAKPSSSQTIIDKALNYIRLPPKNKNLMQHQHENFKHPYPFVGFLNKNSSVIDYYEIDSRFILLPKQSQSCKEKMFCCWFNRQKYIIFKKKNHRMVKYMNMPHKCPVGHCNCCCKGVQNYTQTLTYDILPMENIKHSIMRHSFSVSLTTNKSIKTIKNKRLIQTKNKKQKISKNDKQTNENSVDNIINPVPVNLVVSQPVTNMPSHHLPIDNVTFAEIKENASKQFVNAPLLTAQLLAPQMIPPMLINNQTQAKTLIAPMAIGNQIQADTEHTLGVETLINSVLSRFGDVRLTIDEDGNVQAALNTPLDAFSPAEKKVLSAILSHANQQVKELGLVPGSSLDQHINIANTVKLISCDKNTNDLSQAIEEVCVEKTHENINHNKKNQNSKRTKNNKKRKAQPMITINDLRSKVARPKIISFESQYLNSIEKPNKPKKSIPSIVKNVCSMQNTTECIKKPNILKRSRCRNKTNHDTIEDIIPTKIQVIPEFAPTHELNEPEIIPSVNVSQLSNIDKVVPQQPFQSKSVNTITVDCGITDLTPAQPLEIVPWMPLLVPKTGVLQQPLQNPIPAKSDFFFENDNVNLGTAADSNLKLKTDETQTQVKSESLSSTCTPAIDPIQFMSDCLDNNINRTAAVGNNSLLDLINSSIEFQLSSSPKLPSIPTENILRNLLNPNTVVSSNCVQIKPQTEISNQIINQNDDVETTEVKSYEPSFHFDIIQTGNNDAEQSILGL